MKMLHKHIWKTVLSIGISALVVVYVYINRTSIFSSFAHMEPAYLVIVFAGQVGILFANACLLRSLLRPFEKTIGKFESFKLTTVSSFVNFFTPVVGGASLRAVYLKRAHDLTYARFISVLYANYLMMFTVSFLLGLLGLIGIPGAFSQPAGLIAALFFGGGIIASLLFMMFGHVLLRVLKALPKNNHYLQTFVGKIGHVDEGWSMIRHDKQTLIAIASWSAIATLCVTAVDWAVMQSLGIHGSVWVALIFASLAIVGLLFNITPGSIGIREAVYAGMYGVTGLSLKQVIAFSLIDRPAQLLVICLGWIIFSRGILSAVPKTSPEP